MSIVKKWAGCVMAFIAGVLGLAMSATIGMKVVTKIDASALGLQPMSQKQIVKAFKVLTDSELMDKAKMLGIKSEFVTMKVFAILTLIVAVLLIVYSIVALLQNINVIKSSHIAFNIAGWVLIGLFVVSTIALLITSNAYANALESADYSSLLIGQGIPETYISAVQVKTSATVGLYQPFMLVVSIIAAIVTGIFAFLKRKDA